MGKNSTKGTPAKGKAPANARQAKIQAAQKSGGGGANKIVIATVVVVVAIIAVVGGVIWSETSRTNEITGGGNALPAGVAALGDPYRVYADVTPADGAPTVDVYEDFQCPFCGDYEARLAKTAEDLAAEGTIVLNYHIKNFLDDNFPGQNSTRAGEGAFCAADQGKFLEFHDLVYANQPAQEGAGWTDDQLAGFAQQAGVADLDTWKSCLTAGKYKDYVNSVEEASAKDGVRGTPTIRRNGEDLQVDPTQTTPEQFAAMLQG